MKQNTNEVTEPKIGELYEVLDYCGMVSYKAKYLGIGRRYRLVNENDSKVCYVPFYQDKFYVFEKTSGYKFAAAEPVFEDLKFSYFRAVRYGNDLEHLFMDSPILFSLGGEHRLEKMGFPKPLSKETQNCGMTYRN